MRTLQTQNILGAECTHECRFRHRHKHNITLDMIKAIATWAAHKNNRISSSTLPDPSGPISILRTQKSMFSILHGARQGQASRQTSGQTSGQTSRQTNMQTIVLCQVNHSLKNCCERYTSLPALNFKLASCLNNVLLPAHSSFTISSVN